MIRYIWTEFIRAVKSKYYIKIIIAIAAVSVLANLAMIAFRDYVYGTNDGTYGYNLIMFAGGFFWLPYYTTIFISDMVFGENYPDPFIKDRITKRLRRPQLYLGKLFGAKTVYIEVFDRIDHSTLSGKLIYHVADRFIVQWEDMKKIYPKAINLGSIF